VVLNSLAVIKQSRGHDISAGTAALRGTSGLLVAVMGRLTPGAARQLAASRRDTGPAIALLLTVSTWATPGQDRRPAGEAGFARPDGPRSPASHQETDQAAAVLRAAGWRVACLDASTQLAVAWQQLGMQTSKPPAAHRPPGTRGAAV
jgi:hypothetical protein